MKRFEVANVNCANCAKTIKNALSEKYGVIDVDLSVTPRIVSVDIKQERVNEFMQELDELGFDVIKEL
ncbi:hypothetical protein LMG7974_00548 [Campylobacter majalis]|uniref:HMA domain-containing protein n=1 Tax=Campylobacter majalis TaxID=2790656 RepID=A0ABM8Q4H4_9BACT|nr:heavy-metal-associated domain-containing protein [Campylobacter majalis]CAD7287668.1 hypothetical protein LMG7974_00548 [Campylobacter majalis]